MSMETTFLGDPGMSMIRVHKRLEVPHEEPKASLMGWRECDINFFDMYFLGTHLVP